MTKFFRHLQKHSRPVKAVEGVSVLYGSQPDAVDFDVHFKTLDPRTSPFADMAAKFATLPTAHATANHRGRARNFKEKDLEGRPTLQFALGARIVGMYGFHFFLLAVLTIL